jgi:N-acetylmuramoyl-L-alanine amidase
MDEMDVTEQKPVELELSAAPGEKLHRVKKGECLNEIAYNYGFFWKTIWNFEKNNKLSSTRKDHNNLLEGDQVIIPKKEEMKLDAETETLHRFKLKGIPFKLNIRLMYEGKPYENVPYKLIIDGESIEGMIGSDGFVRERIPPNVFKGLLIVGSGENIKEFNLKLGSLDPYDTITGVQSRLKSLGYDIGQIDGEIGPLTRAAIRAFQASKQLEKTGALSAETCEKIREEFGS